MEHLQRAQHPGGSLEDADVIVIGTDPGGGAAAEQCARQGLRVVVVEREIWRGLAKGLPLATASSQPPGDPSTWSWHTPR